jgi:cell division septation protein DedD
LAQDDYYYEIQLTNKQLVFYFLAGATGLVLSFLAGVMVGRGVDQTAGEVQAARPVAEERVVTEETPKPVPPSAEDLTYAQRLESEKPEEGLQRAKGAAPAGGAPATAAPLSATAPPAASARPGAAPTPAAARPVPARSAPAGHPTAPAPAKPTAAPAVKPTVAPPTSKTVAKAVPGPGSGAFTIQVGAFKDKGSAESVVARLKHKGFAAYVVSPEGEGLFNVRVGNFAARVDAERIQGRLRDEEKFRPFIVKQ